MKNLIKFKPETYIISSTITDQWLAKNLDTNEFEWLKLTPRNSNFQTSFTNKEINEIENVLTSYAKKATSGN